MMDEYKAPGFLSDAPQKEVSPGYFAPLEFPGNVLGMNTRAANFSGGHVHVQFSEMGAVEFPTQNLDGTLRYRRKDEKADVFTAGTITGTPQGIARIAGAVTSGSHLLVEEWGYMVGDFPLPPVGGDPRWEPTIRFQKVTDTSTGAPTGGQFTLNAYFGETATLRTRPWLDQDDADRPKNSGFSELTLPYDQAYFQSQWDLFKAMPSAARRRDDYPGFYGGQSATTSETLQGSYAYLKGLMIWCEPYAISEEIGAVLAYAGEVAVKLPLVSRGNAPILRDLTKGSDTTQIYTSGLTEAFLSEEITEKKWLDERGIYDPTDAGAWDDIGWRPLAFDEVDTVMNGTLPAAYGGKARCRLTSADGQTYRVTLAQSAYRSPDPLVTLPEKVLVVAPGEPEDFNYEFEDYPGFPEYFFSSQLAKLERRLSQSPDVWEEIPVEYGMIRGEFFPGTRLFSMVQVRDGKRWGFLSYPQAGGYPDSESDTMVHGIERAPDARYFRHQKYRQRHNVDAELPE